MHRLATILEEMRNYRLTSHSWMRGKVIEQSSERNEKCLVAGIMPTIQLILLMMK
jgi:hypothetical protein